jgi:hypothetical protein
VCAPFCRRSCSVCVDEYRVLQEKSGEIGDGLGLSSGEKEGLSRFREVTKERGKRTREAHVKNAISFVEH